MEHTNVLKHIRKMVQRDMPALPYHNERHAKDVANTTLIIARKEGITHQRELELLYIGGYIHDVVNHLSPTRGENEAITQGYAKEKLPAHGYTPSEVELIRQGINETIYPYRSEPKSLFGKIIRDSDVANAGRKDFFDRSEEMRLEQNLARRFYTGEPEISISEWVTKQEHFLEGVKFYTSSAQKLYELGRKVNLAIVQSKLS